MTYLLLLLLCIAPYNSAQAMLINGTCHVPVMPSQASMPMQPTLHHRKNGTSNLHHTQPILKQSPVLKAVEEGNTQQVKDYFKEWRRTIEPWDYYNQAVVETLVHAAQFCPEKTGSVVEYLLPRVSSAFLEDATLSSLLQAAVDNNHPAILEYVHTTFGPEYTAHALDTALVEGNAQKVHTLLAAGVNPYFQLSSHDSSPALYRALRVFSAHDNPETTQQRLTILESLLAHLKPEDIPAGFEINLCYNSDDKRYIPQDTRSKVVQLLNDKHVPARLCMDEDDTSTLAPSTPKNKDYMGISSELRAKIEHAVKNIFYPPQVYDSSIGIADTDIDLYTDDDTSTQTAFVTNFSPLHQAAQVGDYKTCLVLLTEFKEPILQNEKFPLKALKIIQDPKYAKAATYFKSAPEEYKTAMRTMSAFTVNMQKRLDKQFALAKALRIAKDSLGRTPLDIAPAHLSRLLDPHNNSPIQQVVTAHLQAEFMGSIPAAQVQYSNKPLKVGDKVIVNGKKYIVSEKKKTE